MKKLASILLALILVMSLGATAFAATTVGTGDQSIDVEAKYQDNTTSATVYSVDIAWGAMKFTYTESGAMTWNPADHTYTSATTAGWTADGNTVTVTNHSNAAVTASFAFAALDAYKTVTGSFDVASKTLEAGKVNGYDSADNVTATLTLGGALTNTVTDFTKIGTVTVTIA